MRRTGRKQRKYEVYKVTAMRMLLYSYTSWTEKVWTNIRNKTSKTRKNK